MNITVPESLNEITIRQYIEFLKQTKDVTNEEFVNRKMVEIFCNIKDDITKIPFTKFQDTYEILINAFNEKQPLQPTFELNGVTYGFIPKLEEVSLGEVINLDEYLGNDIMYAEAMSVMYRPVTVKHKKLYKIEDYKADTDLIEVMLDAPLGVFQGAMVFFYHLGNDLTTATLPFLKEAMEETLQQQDNSEQDGDGIRASMDLLEATLQSLTRLQV